MLRILVINCGSSSIKYELFEMPSQRSLVKGSIEHIGESGARIKNHYTGLKMILTKIDKVDAVGHRLVHGGERFKEPALIDRNVIAKISACCRLAPLHNPANLEGIIAIRRLLGDKIPQVAVFDTAFYTSLPSFAYIYGLPYELYKQLGIRR